MCWSPIWMVCIPCIPYTAGGARTPPPCGGRDGPCRAAPDLPRRGSLAGSGRPGGRRARWDAARWPYALTSPRPVVPSHRILCSSSCLAEPDLWGEVSAYRWPVM